MVVFSDKAYNAIIRETFEWDPVETGGILLGHILDNGCWIVMEVLPPGYSEGQEGNNVHHEMGYFEYNQRFVNYLAKSVATQYKIPLELLGLWHRHPGSMDFFSPTDDGTNRTFASLNTNGVISGLINIDPQLRLTLYHLEHNAPSYGRPNYTQVDYEVGSDLIPEEYFELKFYDGDEADLHPFAPRRNDSAGSTSSRTRRSGSSAHTSSGQENLDIGRILSEQTRDSGEQHTTFTSNNNDWRQQLGMVLEELKKKKWKLTAFFLLIIASYFSLSYAWHNVKKDVERGKQALLEWLSPKENTIPTPPPAPVTYEISDNELKLPVGKTYQLSVSPQPKESLKWHSSNEEIVKVQDNGNIESVGDGVVDVTVSIQGQTLTCHVCVEEIKQPVHLEIQNGRFSDECELKIGEQHSLCFQSDQNEYDKTAVSWKSKDEAIVSVDDQGRIKAIAKGSAVIYLLYENVVQDSIKINSKPKP